MHFFCDIGHPEVYVLIIPALLLCLKSFPYFRASYLWLSVMVGATVCIAFVSLSVWAHHMFTIGMNSYANAFFTITNDGVGVPTGIKIFNWLGTMWGGKLIFKTHDALLYRISVPILDRRSHGHHAVRRTVQLAAQRFLLRRRALSLRDRGRHLVRPFRGFY